MRRLAAQSDGCTCIRWLTKNGLLGPGGFEAGQLNVYQAEYQLASAPAEGVADVISIFYIHDLEPIH